MGKKRGSYESQRYEVVLDCLHWLVFKTPAPKIDSQIWCVRCDDPRLVISSNEMAETATTTVQPLMF